MTYHPSHSGLVEALEPRIALSATPLSVARALDLSDDITVTLSGNGASFATQILGSTGQLLGFPSGGDGDFLILSTGIASHLTTLEDDGSGLQGTDLGAPGAEGDTASVKFTLAVPAGSSFQRFKMDFMFLTEEYPEFLNQGFNDTFEVFINGTNIAEDEFGAPIEVDNAFFTGEAAPGTYFDGRTNRLTLNYIVPNGVTTLEVELRLSDVGDGIVDSAVLVDNARFESAQVVYLDFDGASLSNHFGQGINALIPGFSASDLGFAPEQTQAVIEQIVQELQAKFAAYDIFFTTDLPTSGDFTTLFVGGDNDMLLDISGASPLLRRQHPGASIGLGDLFDLGGDSLLGFAGSPDVGNFDRNDVSVIFSGEFDDFFGAASLEERLDHLVVTLAHELGHNLGLRHVDDTATADIMKHNAPRLPDATFGNTLLNLTEEWSDGATQQNDHVYLTSVLGQGNASGLAFSVQETSNWFTITPPTGLGPMFDVTITITTGDPFAAPITLFFDKLDSTDNIPLENLPVGAKISILASSQPGGPADIFSGTPTSGEIGAEETFVPLFAANGSLLAIPLAKGTPGALTASGSLTLATNDLGDVTVLPGKVATFTDSDGDVYTIRLTGPGMIGYVLNDPDQDGKGGMLRLSLDDTSAASSVLSITVKKGRFGDGIVHFGEITGALGSGLKSLTAPAVNFDGGGIVFSGGLGTVSIRDLLNGANLVANGDDSFVTSITARLVADGSNIAIGNSVSTLKLAYLGEAGVTVDSLAKLMVVGDKAASLPGDIGGHITVGGLLGSVTARDLLSGAIIEAQGNAFDRTTLALHEVMNGASITLASLVTSLKAARIGDAAIHAQQFDSITITGDARNFIPGDFAGDITAVNKIGKFTARDLLSTASIDAGGTLFDRATFTTHAISDGVTIELDGGISTFKAAYVGAATIEVAAITTLQVLGDANAFLPGDFHATVLLSGGDLDFVNGINSVTIKGNMIGARIEAEMIGKMTVRGMVGSTILVGFTPDPGNEDDPFAGGTFTPGAKITSISVGLGGFADSVIASTSIGTVAMSYLLPSNGGTTFGILTAAAPTKVSISGFNYLKGGPADQSLLDFHLKVV